MSTLTTTPLAPLLERLFDEDAAASPSTNPAWANLTHDERSRLLRSKTDYLDFYERMKDFPLAVSRGTGTLLYMLARLRRANDRRVRNVVRHLDAASRRGAPRQWRRPSHHQRVRAVQGGARATRC